MKSVVLFKYSDKKSRQTSILIVPFLWVDNNLVFLSIVYLWSVSFLFVYEVSDKVDMFSWVLYLTVEEKKLVINIKRIISQENFTTK